MAQHTLNAPMWTAISMETVTFGVQQVSMKQQSNLKQTAIIGENVTNACSLQRSSESPRIEETQKASFLKKEVLEARRYPRLFSWP